MLELLRYMLEGNWKELDKTYKRIEMTHQDQFIGQIMMENDYKEVMESIEKAEQAMSEILQKADENRKEKKRFLLRCDYHLQSCTILSKNCINIL